MSTSASIYLHAEPSPQQLATLSLLAAQLHRQPESPELFHGFWARATNLPRWVLPHAPDGSWPEITDVDGVPAVRVFTSLRRATVDGVQSGRRGRPLTAVSPADLLDGLERVGAERLVLDPGFASMPLATTWLRDLLQLYATRPDLATASIDLPPLPTGAALLERTATEEEILVLAAHGADIERPDREGNDPPFSNRIRMGLPATALLGLGADLEGASRSQYRALHNAADRLRPESVRLLLALGADVHARTFNDREPLGMAANRATVADDLSDIEALVDIAEILVAAGAPVSKETTDSVVHVGRAREAQRHLLAPQEAARQDALLARLSAATGVPPQPRVVVSPETHAIATGSTPEEKFAALRAQLVARPDGGEPTATTVQGEVVRICDALGQIAASEELALRDPEVWRSLVAEATALATSWQRHLTTGVDSVSQPAWDTVLGIEHGELSPSSVEYMRRLTVTWVGENPELVPLTSTT